MDNVKARNPKWIFFKNSVLHSDVRQSKTKKILAAIFAILASLLLAIIIACSVCGQWANAGKLFALIFTSGFDSNASLNTLFSNMSILIVAGLAFIFAYKAGLFNIGISGQMVMGGTLGTMVAHMSHLPSGGAQIVILIVCTLGGAIVGALAGLLKAYLNVNEVVSSIMLNWIIYFMSILLLSSLTAKGLIPGSGSGDYTESPSEGVLFRINGNAFGPLLILSAILIIFVAVILNYTVFGKKQKVVGLSRTGALASGYNVKLNMILSMFISGAIAGVLGAMVYCGFNPQMPITATAKAIPQEGFNGISVGLIGMCSPLASIPVSLFFSMVQTSVSAMQSIGIDNHIANVVFGIVVYGSAAIALFLNMKPYWWTLGIFKGKNYSKIKHEKNQSEVTLLEMANDYNELLKKYYMYRVKNIKVISSFKITPAIRAKMWVASVKYKLINFWYGKVRKWDARKMATIRSMNNLQNEVNGLQYKYDIANQNKLDLETLMSTERQAMSLGVPDITNRHQYKLARAAFIKAYYDTVNALKEHYDKQFKAFTSTKKDKKNKNKYVFIQKDVAFDPALIEKTYIENLKSEISKVRELITRPTGGTDEFGQQASNTFWRAEE